MGQRHQAFLIAKIRPHGSPDAKYRCIAAYHHQWCYGSLPLRAVHRLITLLRQPENAAVVREELRLIDGKYGVYEQEPIIPDIPCPFTATLFGAAWDMDFTRETAYISSGFLLEASMGSWDGDNNEGITVIDVTNTEEPACGFLKSRTSLLSGLQYVKRYHDVAGIRARIQNAPAVIDLPEDASDELRVDHWEQMFHRAILQAVDALAGVPRISFSALAEAWPGEYSPKVKPSQGDLGASPPKDASAIEGVPSLMDITFRQTLEQSLQTGTAVDLDELPTFPEKMRIVEDLLSNFKLSPPPEAADSLVIKLAESKYSNRYLDFAGYTFSDEQVLAAVTALPEIRILNLSRNSALTTKGVRDLLFNVSSLQSLVLLDCPQVRADELAKLTHEEPSIFHNLLSLAHPDFMFEPPPGTNRSIGISIFWDLRFTTAGVTLPFLNPTYVLQGLLDIVTVAADDKNYKFHMSAGRVVEVAYSALPREETRPWRERVIMSPQSLEKNPLGGNYNGWVLLLSGRLLEAGVYGFLRVREGESLQVASEDEGESTSGDEDETMFEATSASGGEEVSTSEGGEVSASVAEVSESASAVEEVSASGGGEATASEGEEVSMSVDEDSEEKDSGGDSLRGDQVSTIKDSNGKYPKVIKRFPKHELHDIRSFVSTTTQEGYPAVPEEIVSQLEALMSKSSWRVVDESHRNF